MDPARGDVDRQAKSGEWYRLARLPALTTFGRRFDAIMAEYEIRSNDPANIERAQEQMVETHERRLRETGDLLKDRLDALRATDPQRLRDLTERMTSGPLAPHIGAMFPGLAALGLGGSPPRQPAAPQEDVLAALMKQIESIKDSNPFMYEHMKKEMEQTQAKLAAQASEHSATAAEARRPRTTPAEGIRVRFAGSRTISTNHERLFEWLVANQERIAADVRACLAGKATEINESLADWVDADARMLLPSPADPSGRDDRIRVESVTLDAVAPIVGLHFATTWAEADPEHGGEFVVYYHDGTICCSGDAASPDWDESFLESASEDLLSRFEV
jgi:hypothetical protein